MEVLIGDVYDPATMWVAPVFLDQVKDMETRLSSDLISGKFGDEAPDTLAIGLRVAVKSSRSLSLWQRAKILSVDHVVGRMFDANDQIKVDVFLLDAGKTIKNIDVATRIRSLPEEYNGYEDKAFIVRLEGLVPIAKMADYSRRGQFKTTVSRSWNEQCTQMVHALIKVSHRQIFQDSEVDVGLRVKGGNTIRVGKLVLELPLMIKPKHQERLMPYTSYITAGMWLQGERRLLDLNQCLMENDFAIKIKNEEMFSNSQSLQPILTLLDENEAENAYYNSFNTSSSVGGAAGGGGNFSRCNWDQLFSRAGVVKSVDDSVAEEAARKKTEDWLLKHLADIERHEQEEASKKNLTNVGIPDDDSIVVDSDGEMYYNCKEELE